MTDLDAMARYEELRRENGMQPHDIDSADDLQLLDFFLSGVVSGTRTALLKVRDHGQQAAAR